MLGPNDGEGFVHLMRNLPQERMSIAVAAVAAAETVLEQTIEYCKSRQAFGRNRFGELGIAGPGFYFQHEHGIASRRGRIIFQLAAVVADEGVGIFDNDQPPAAAE